MSDTSRIGELVSWGAMDGVWNISYIIGAIIVMISIDWKLALLVTAVVPFAALVVAIVEGKRKNSIDAFERLTRALQAASAEGITGAKTIKTLVIEDKMESEFRAITSKMKKTAVTTARFSAIFSGVTSLASFVALALVLWRGGILTESGLMETGDTFRIHVVCARHDGSNFMDC